MKIIGLTGGIASGKTTVAHFLEELGAVVIDADSIGHEVLRSDSSVRKAVVVEFGKDVLSEDGEISREKLGDMVFGSPERLIELNWITHPRIIDRVHDLLDKYRADGVEVVILEAALLLEADLDSMVDEVWVTVASEATIIRRLTERTGLSEADSLARIRSQLPALERLKQADTVIDTDCPLDELKSRVTKLWRGFSGGE